jgi:hypothetical protein
VILRERAMRQANTNQPAGKGYNQAFGALLPAHGFIYIDPKDGREKERVDKGTRSRLFECLARRADIEAWRATLTLNERLTYNHPLTVLRRFKAATQVPDPDKPKKPSQMEKLHNRNVALQEEVDALEKRLERAADGVALDDQSLADYFADRPADDIVDLLVRAAMPTAKMREVAQGLNKAVKGRKTIDS